MRKDKIIYLITFTKTKNDLRDSVKTPVRRETFAKKKSVRQSEFYQAAATDLRPVFTLVVWTLEYKNESVVEVDGIMYNIIRTYEPDEKDTELTCSGLVNKAVP